MKDKALPLLFYTSLIIISCTLGYHLRSPTIVPVFVPQGVDPTSIHLDTFPDPWTKNLVWDTNSCEEYKILNLPNESKFYHGELIQWVIDFQPGTKDILLAGEERIIGNALSSIWKPRTLTTAGFGDVDIPWDFDHSPPIERRFDIIVSQAILEHITEPSKHLRDLWSLLEPQGILIVHTVMPGYGYHKYPIDCQRFYPDFFEAMEKYGLRPTKRRTKDLHIFYMYEK